ncbi:MAG: hypothetical protein ABGY75_22055 [Gemmataceae bacterium]
MREQVRPGQRPVLAGFSSPWKSEPVWSLTDLQILGVYLVGDLRVHGVLKQGEVRRLVAAFNTR